MKTTIPTTHAINQSVAVASDSYNGDNNSTINNNIGCNRLQQLEPPMNNKWLPAGPLSNQPASQI